MIDYKWAGMIGCLFFFIVWIILYFHKKELRKEMWIMSLLIMPAGPISELLYLKDYWHPQYLIKIFGLGIEDLLFAFFIGGIGAVIYEELFIKKIRKGKREHSKTIALLGVIGVILTIFLNLYLHINSIYSTSVVLILIGIMVIMERHDLLKNAIGNGILVSLLMFIFYIIYTAIFPTIIQDWWKLQNISGVILLGAPLEELLWGFSWGFLAGPLYEFWKDLHNK
jgi:hypothetical protein